MEESKRMKTVCNVTVDLKKGKNKEAVVWTCLITSKI